MKLDEMDDLLKKEFAPDFEEIIPELFLSDINVRLDQLEKKKKRRVLFIWFFSFFFVFGATTLVYLVNGNNPQITRSKTNKLNHQFKNLRVSHKIDLRKRSGGTAKSMYSPDINKSQILATYQVRNQYLNGLYLNKNVKKYSGLNESDLAISKILVESLTNEKNPGNKSLQITELPENLNSMLDTSKSEELRLEKINDSVVVIIETKSKIELEKEKENKINRFSVGLFSGVSGVFSSIKINSDYPTTANMINLKTYRETRRQQERMTSSWDLALRVQMIQKKMTFQSGIEYFEWGEQLVYDYNSITGINRFSYLNIPLNIGYFYEKEKFGINPFVGISVGLGIRRDGIYLNTDLSSLSVVSSEKVASTFQTGVQLAYGLEQFTVSIIPIYRMSLAPVVNQGIIRNSYKSLGLQMGLSYRF
jgi:hypothetical protein